MKIYIHHYYTEDIFYKLAHNTTNKEFNIIDGVGGVKCKYKGTEIEFIFKIEMSDETDGYHLLDFNTIISQNTKDIKFENVTKALYKKDISIDHAKKALEMHSSMKPIQKGEFESRLAKSHTSFHSAIKGEPPEKAKPKISLGSMRRESVEQVDEVRGTIKASDKRNEIAVTTTNPKTGEPEVKYMTLPKKDIKVTEATDKVNMQQDSINRLVKMSPLAAKMKVKLPPTQGNKPIGGEEQVHANMAEETLNRLYESLSNSNKVKFMEKFNTENGIDSLLHFAPEQGF